MIALYLLGFIVLPFVMALGWFCSPLIGVPMVLIIGPLWLKCFGKVFL